MAWFSATNETMFLGAVYEDSERLSRAMLGVAKVLFLRMVGTELNRASSILWQQD
ncbi:MAG: hypothetical protein IPM54_38725 [Polyangiaceae bacterium]|nr:hypothetical protein [Polyangiaceae bacterium]